MTDRTAALKAARAKDSNDKRRRVLQTLNAMETAGQPITAAAVAAAAGVSTWLVYADGIREHLDAARHRQAADGDPPATVGTHTGQQPVTSAGLRTDLAVARHEIHQATNRSRQTPWPSAVATRCRDRTTQPGRTHRTGRRVGSREPAIPRRTRRPRN